MAYGESTADFLEKSEEKFQDQNQGILHHTIHIMAENQAAIQNANDGFVL